MGDVGSDAGARDKNVVEVDEQEREITQDAVH